MKLLIPTIISLSQVSGFGSYSSDFTRQLPLPSSARRMGGTMFMYEVSREQSSSGNDRTNLWSALAETENWLANVLRKSGSSNPYMRKEVTYLCDLSDQDALVVAGFWRRLREAREQGRSYSRLQEQKLIGKSPDHNPHTFRQSQVLVLPNDSHLDNFHIFDALVTKIHECRQNARDYMLDVKLEKGDEKKEIGERDWSVSVNFAHLHPKFGQQTKEEILEELKREEEEGVIDVNLKLYKEKRLLARRSPYPTVCIEVQATPPPDFSEAGPSQGSQTEINMYDEEDRATSEDVQRFEKIFGLSASLGKKSGKGDDTFYDAIASVDGIEEISIMSPLKSAQEWIAEHHNSFNMTTSIFSSTKCQQIDEGCEFVFSNIAMKQSLMLDHRNTSQYLVFERFMSKSATSFEKFSKELDGLISLLPSLKGKLNIDILHPEHLSSSYKSPVPVLVMSWK